MYEKQRLICRTMTRTGILIALNQKDSLTPDAKRAYLDELQYRAQNNK